MRKHILIKVILCLMVLGTIPSKANSANFINGIVMFRDKLEDGTAVEAKLQKKKIASQYPYAHAFMWGGLETKMPESVLTSLEVFIGTEKIYVPLSAYSDLGNPRQVLFKRTKKGFQLLIQGGDAAGSYNAVLEFSNRVIIRRKVRHGEFPDQVWEETVYSFIDADSEM